MSTPVCLANAVADALDIDNVELPMTLSRVASWFSEEESPSSEKTWRPSVIDSRGAWSTSNNHHFFMMAAIL